MLTTSRGLRVERNNETMKEIMEKWKYYMVEVIFMLLCSFFFFPNFFRAGMMWVFMAQSKFRLLILMVWQTMEWSWTTTMCHQFALQVAVLSWQENIPYTQVNICYNQLNILYTPVGNYQVYLLQFKFFPCLRINFIDTDHEKKKEREKFNI